jgi:CRP-like cAMP-binding protein
VSLALVQTPGLILDSQESPLIYQSLCSNRFLPDTERRSPGLFSRVPFFANLQMKDLIDIGCMLKHQHVTNVASTGEKTWIMSEGARGTEMWIIEKGEVQIERNVTGSSSAAVGKLGPLDVFGEMAVLVQESPGVPLPRMRSASAVTQSVFLLCLDYNDVRKLREGSVAIDCAVRQAVAAVRRNRPSLFKEHDHAAESAVGLGQKVDELGAKVDVLMSDMALIKAKLLS